jgi:hypothetical protein
MSPHSPEMISGPPLGITVLTGRFGSGKTEISLNYALYLTRCGLSPILIDLDIVTPYFRTRDKASELSQRGVEVVTPYSVGQHIDVPAISPRIRGAIEQSDRPVVIDLGGDKQGSRALAQYASTMNGQDYAMNFVVNPYRPFMDTVENIRKAVQEIESSSRLNVSALISNPNLMSETSRERFIQGHRLIVRTSRALGLRVAFAVMSESLLKAMNGYNLDVPVLVIHRFFEMFNTA